MSLHHERVVHGSGPNRSKYKRIGFAVRYVAPEVNQGLEHHVVVLARGRDAFGHFEHLAAPPGDDLAEGMERQRAFAEAARLRRRLAGSPALGRTET